MFSESVGRNPGQVRDRCAAGRYVAGAWQMRGKCVAGAWQVRGRRVADAWQIQARDRCVQSTFQMGYCFQTRGRQQAPDHIHQSEHQTCANRQIETEKNMCIARKSIVLDEPLP